MELPSGDQRAVQPPEAASRSASSPVLDTLHTSAIPASIAKNGRIKDVVPVRRPFGHQLRPLPLDQGPSGPVLGRNDPKIRR